MNDVVHDDLVQLFWKSCTRVWTTVSSCSSVNKLACSNDLYPAHFSWTHKFLQCECLGYFFTFFQFFEKRWKRLKTLLEEVHIYKFIFEYKSQLIKRSLSFQVTDLLDVKTTNLIGTVNTKRGSQEEKHLKDNKELTPFYESKLSYVAKSSCKWWCNELDIDTDEDSTKASSVMLPSHPANDDVMN